jgi:hypothetical protein
LTGCWIAAAREGLSSGGVKTAEKKKVRVVISGKTERKDEKPNEKQADKAEHDGPVAKKRRAVIGRGGWR